MAGKSILFWRRNPSQSGADSRKTKRRRGAITIAGSTIVFLVLTSAIFQAVLYRQNLAMAGDELPPIKSLREGDRLLIVSPHCDDETLGAGGTVAAARNAGIPVRVVFLTNGDGSRSTQVVDEARHIRQRVDPRLWRRKAASDDETAPSVNTFQRIAKMRQEETVAALKVLGVAERDVIFLGYPDGGTQALWQENWARNNPYRSPYTHSSRSPYESGFTPNAVYSGEQVADDLTSILRVWKPTVVMTTHPEDTHPDHWAAYGFTGVALQAWKQEESTPAVARRARLLTFLVHHGPWPVPHGFHPEASLMPPASLEDSDTRWLHEPLTDFERQAKQNALEAYTSQLVFTPHYLRSFVRRNELFGTLPVGVATPGTRQLLLRDPHGDSWWREMWPAADVRELHAELTDDHLTLQTDLARVASGRVRYRYALHVISQGKISAYKLEARRDGKNLRATLSSLSNAKATNYPLSGKLHSNGYSFEVPRKALGGLGSDAKLLVSASTHAGNARFDQTAMASLQMKSPTPRAH